MYNNHAGAAFASRRAVIGNYRVCVFFIRGYPPGARTKPAPFLNSHANFMDLRRRKMILLGWKCKSRNCRRALALLDKLRPGPRCRASVTCLPGNVAQTSVGEIKEETLDNITVCTIVHSRRNVVNGLFFNLS